MEHPRAASPTKAPPLVRMKDLRVERVGTTAFYPRDMWKVLAAWFALASGLFGFQGPALVNLGPDASDIGQVRSQFEAANPGHTLEWLPDTPLFQASAPTVAFVQVGEGMCTLGKETSPYEVGDLLRLRQGDTVLFDPPAGVLVFTLPKPLAASRPSNIRPDWDENITDTPGGCATEGDAYRRILLTWQGKNGPYLSRQINAHRVRIWDSFTHYHPKEGGFDEFYLVQEAPPGARLVVGEDLAGILDPDDLGPEDAAGLLRSIPIQPDDLVYLPRGMVHRGVGGAVVQVITVPGFVPGAEIGVDRQLEEINSRFELQGDRALPVHRGPGWVEVTPTAGGGAKIYIGGRPFTELKMDRRHPDFWPLRNSAGQALSRAWPREGGQGGKQDHPHHQSLWFAHGKIDGLDFWHDPEAKVRANRILGMGSGEGRGWLEMESSWSGPSDREVFSDRRRIDFFKRGSAWGLDFSITLEAGGDGLVFGDTKEGTFALRLAAELVADQGGTLVNSEGNRGKVAWGQRSRWVMASGELSRGPAAVAVMDHPGNPRHPTPWHARTYGLVAANPFGLHAFEGAPEGSGRIEIPPGESLQFRWRVVLFPEIPAAEKVETLFLDFANS